MEKETPWMKELTNTPAARPREVWIDRMRVACTFVCVVVSAVALQKIPKAGKWIVG